jgi:hypothetical protein
MSHKTGRLAANAFVCSINAFAFIMVLSSCGGKVDDRFAAESYDEYTQPLTNAVIGTPAGIITVGPSTPADGGTVSSSSGGSSSSSSGGSSGSSSGGSGGGGSIDGGGADGGAGGGFGFWHLDDCSPTSHFLIDSSGEGANAQHALNSACVPGISGLGVQIRSQKDVIQVPDEPQFTVGTRVAVAAWVHPTTVTGHQPIVIKRLNNQTAFSLGIHNGNIEMSVVLTTGTTVISSAPIAAGTWTHVAGMYDGTFVFLFINGQQFGQVFAAGTVRDVFAPIRIGATSQTQHVNGIVDEVFLSTQAITKDQLTALACISHPSTLAVSPAKGGPVTFDTTVHYDVQVTNNDIGACQPANYEMFFNRFRSFDGGGFDPTINAVVDPPQFVPNVQPGTTVTFGAEVTASSDAIPGVHEIPFIIDRFTNSPPFRFEQFFGQLSFELTAPTGCFVFTRRELMITDTSVVDDPVRTLGVTTPGLDGGVGFGDAGTSIVDASSPGLPLALPLALDASPGPDAGANPSLGVWTFGHLMRELAPTPADAPAMTLQLFQHWLTNQTVNGFTVAARPAIQQVLLDVWPKTTTGALDLDQAPLRLQAIVNRIDLRNLAAGSAGEGRFVFAVNGAFGSPQSFTVILEYNLPAKTQQDVLDWANLWHGLSSHPFPSEEYNAALETITRRFSGRSPPAAGLVNGSNLLELRTNEIALSFQWELRGFVLSPTTGFFDETTVKETPDLSFNGTQTFADFVNQNEAAIIAVVPGAMAGTVPLQFGGKSFLAGSVFNNQIEWSAPGIKNPEARFHASLNTCNGCHGPESGTFNFTMIDPRFAGTEATLSPFLTGTTVVDRTTRLPRTLNDLARRRADLTGLVCPTDAGPPPSDGAPPPTDAGPPG